MLQPMALTGPILGQGSLPAAAGAFFGNQVAPGSQQVLTTGNTPVPALGVPGNQTTPAPQQPGAGNMGQSPDWSHLINFIMQKLGVNMGGMESAMGMLGGQLGGPLGNLFSNLNGQTNGLASLPALFNTSGIYSR